MKNREIMTESKTTVTIGHYFIMKIGAWFTFGAMASFGLFVIISGVGGALLYPIDDSDKSRFDRSGFRIYTDHKTSLQYISSGGCLTPRLDIDGNQIKEKNE